jgi:hypothetical protein
MLPGQSRVAQIFNVPFLRRVAFHLRRISGQIDRQLFY